MTSLYDYGPQSYHMMDRLSGHRHNRSMPVTNGPPQAYTSYGQAGYDPSQYVALGHAHPAIAPTAFQTHVQAVPQMYAPHPAYPTLQNSTYSCGANNHNYYLPPQYLAPSQAYVATNQQQQQPQQQQPLTGGISEVLDYDVESMSKYMTNVSFQLFSRATANTENFQTSIKSVLNATRLPLSSLILAHFYLFQKYDKVPSQFENNFDDSIYQDIVLSLVLANKANDDNTFTNKSWSDATGLKVSEINKLEAHWLSTLEWRLHNIDMSKYELLCNHYNDFIAEMKAIEDRKLQELHQRQQNQLCSLSEKPPISPILNAESNFPQAKNRSPISYSQNSKDSHGWFSNYEYSNYSLANAPSNALDFRYNENPFYRSHQKNYSVPMEPEFCSRTGSYRPMAYCNCHFCSPSKRNIWSYNAIPTAAY